MTKLDDKRFTRKQADRILADAAERESRNYGTELGEGLTYTQIVKSAEEAGIDPKYLKRSAKDLVKEVGGLEKAAVGRMYRKAVNSSKDITHGFKSFLVAYFILPTGVRLHDDNGEGRDFSDFSVGMRFVGGSAGILAYLVTLNDSLARLKFFPEEFQPYLIPLASIATATQVGSGLYEWYRREKNKLVEEMNGEDKK